MNCDGYENIAEHVFYLSWIFLNREVGALMHTKHIHALTGIVRKPIIQVIYSLFLCWARIWTTTSLDIVQL